VVGRAARREAPDGQFSVRRSLSLRGISGKGVGAIFTPRMWHHLDAGWQGQGDRSYESLLGRRRCRGGAARLALTLSGRALRARTRARRGVTISEGLPSKSGAFVLGFQVLALATLGVGATFTPRIWYYLDAGWQGQGDRSYGLLVRRRRCRGGAARLALTLSGRAGARTRARRGVTISEGLPSKSGAFVLGFQVLARATPGR